MPREFMEKKSLYSDNTVLLIGVAAMLLAAIFYVWLGFPPDISPTE